MVVKGCGLHEGHSHSVKDEIITHFPYAIFSLALGMIILSFLSFFEAANSGVDTHHAYNLLFHSFHFLHIIFAATGALITYFRFSKNVWKGLLVGAFSASFFCILSDILMPYLAGRILGVHMHFHICFITEFHNIVPFLAVGLLNGFVMSRHCETKQSIYSLGSHFSHILVSALASLFYIVGNGLHNWAPYMGPLFILLIFAVLAPCTISDVVVPMWLASRSKK